MIKIEFSKDFKEIVSKYGKELKIIKSEPVPDFEKVEANPAEFSEKAKKYGNFKNVILIGNGGSRTSAYAFCNSLTNFRNDVNFEFLNSAEPALINKLRNKCSKEDTLVLAVSKSGDNINALEPLMAMIDYPVVVITGEKDSPLRKVAEKRNLEIIEHLEVSGRFSGMTSCGLFPVALTGISAEKIYEGAKEGYEKYNASVSEERNDALKLAVELFDLEQEGFVEIFLSIYSTPLSAFLPLIIQLIHESAGKNGMGQTIFGDYSPESQHHTNQRIFGGRKNVVGLFVGVEKDENDFPLKVPEDLKDISFKNQTLATLDGISAEKTMHYDMEGVMQNAKNKKIPAIGIMIEEINEKSVGEFMVFWQYVAFYSALLRGQDPFNQPEVEESKEISFLLRKNK